MSIFRFFIIGALIGVCLFATVVSLLHKDDLRASVYGLCLILSVMHLKLAKDFWDAAGKGR